MTFCREQQVGMLEVERGHIELYVRQLQSRRLGASHSDIQHALNQADPRTTDLYLRGDKGGSVSRHLVAELLAS